MEESGKKIILKKMLKTNKLESKKCKICQKDFKPHHGLQTICSYKCQQVKNKEYKKEYLKKKPKKDLGTAFCIINECRKEFIKTTANKITCSKLCSLKNCYDTNRSRERLREAKNPNFWRDKSREYRERLINPPPSKHCVECDKKIPQRRGLNAITCSQMCSLKRNKKVNVENQMRRWHQKKFDKWWEENKERLLSKIRDCKVCKKEFKPSRSQLCCSLKCSAELKSQQKKAIYQKRKLEGRYG